MTVDQATRSACSVSAWLYAGHAFLLHELIVTAVMKRTTSKKTIFLMPDNILIIYKNILFISKTNFMPEIIFSKIFSS